MRKENNIDTNKGTIVTTSVIADGTIKYTLTDNIFAAYSSHGWSKHIATLSRISAMRQLDRHLRELRYGDTVVVEFGGDICKFDWTNNSEQAEQKSHLTIADINHTYVRVINRIRNAGANPVLLTLPSIEHELFFKNIKNNLNTKNLVKWLDDAINNLNNLHRQYNAELCNISQELNIPVIDTTTLFNGKDDIKDYYNADGIHLNEAGNALVAEAIRKFRF